MDLIITSFSRRIEKISNITSSFTVKEILSQREKKRLLFHENVYHLQDSHCFRCNFDPVCIGFVFDTTADQICKTVHVGGGEFVSNENSDVFSKKQGTKANSKIRL